ncbi:MAG: hypothetical protein JST87_05295 [Bacteroidetes bacterium]|nr:hypothetical protein [Bacteroidota bacterium]
MPISKKTLQKIATLLKLDQAKVDAAAADEKEVDLEIADDLSVFNKTEITARDKNGYDSGKKAGEEMLAKKIKKDHAIDITGDDMDKVIDAIINKAKAEANANPDARVTEMETTLKKAKTELEKANLKIEKLEVEKETSLTNQKLLSHFPSNRIDTMTNDELLTLVNSRIKIVKKDGKEVVVKDGEEVLDKSLNPVPVKDAIAQYFTERKWIKEEQQNRSGRGGGNSNPQGGANKFQKMSEVTKYLQDNGINIQGEKAMQIISAAKKENPQLDMNS